MNFHLKGPGLDKATSIKKTGTTRWTVTLRAGTYTFKSDAGKRIRGSFVVS